MKDGIKDLLGGWHDMAVKAGHALADKLDALIDNLFPRDQLSIIQRVINIYV